MRHVLRWLTTLGLLLVVPVDASADWTRLRSTNVLFIGDATERQIRQTARQLERFRGAMTCGPMNPPQRVLATYRTSSGSSDAARDRRPRDDPRRLHTAPVECLLASSEASPS